VSGANYCTGYTTAPEVPAAAAAQPRNPMSAWHHKPHSAVCLPHLQLLQGCLRYCWVAAHPAKPVAAPTVTQLLSASCGEVRRAPGICICQCQGRCVASSVVWPKLELRFATWKVMTWTMSATPCQQCTVSWCVTGCEICELHTGKARSCSTRPKLALSAVDTNLW
jgi:hypothetical protein